jgi:MSHA biogenesis protein MshP
MNHIHHIGKMPARMRGASLITALFLVVVLAGLTAAVVRLVMVQQATAAMDMLGVQAYQAARSGLEWGLFQQLRVPRPPPLEVGCFTSPSTFAMPQDGGLRNFTVTVTCAAAAGNLVGNTTNRWAIAAVACNQPGPAGCPNPSNNAEYVQRRVQAELN